MRYTINSSVRAAIFAAATQTFAKTLYFTKKAIRCICLGKRQNGKRGRMNKPFPLSLFLFTPNLFDRMSYLRLIALLSKIIFPWLIWGI
ncbi:MAG TPA: hypothetical protein DCY88_15150 [Cyanobacteria bacterium UBA11372]|nr:hypothetical protein [Cyanobacteria bacterium UBA11372]